MKHLITDVLQVMAAVLITGGVLVSAAPLPQKQIIEPVAHAEIQPELPKKVAPKKVKKITWRDNPNKCNQKTHYIAKEKPFKCIRKATSASPVATSKAPAFAPSGNCAQWMDQAGITHPMARELIGRESGCNPCAYNPGMSDCGYTGDRACGIPQALPCSKLRAACRPWTDAVCQLRWMERYVLGRYGSWEAAKAHHDRYNWY